MRRPIGAARFELGIGRPARDTTRRASPSGDWSTAIRCYGRGYPWQHDDRSAVTRVVAPQP